MNLYFAPLEGITTYTYRNTHSAFFGGCDAYYAPFITPSDNEKNSRKNMRDILPENNKNISLKIQALVCRSDSFARFAQDVKKLGYSSININLGCPSGTVVKKKRGSGFLRYPDELRLFLEEIFAQTDLKISLKTRIGYHSSDEFDCLLDIYNQFKLSLLVIHPRVREAFYKGEPEMDVYARAYRNSENKLCYNGNIFSASDYHEVVSRFPNTDSVMIGRGAIANPAIFREIKGGKRLTTDELVGFTNVLAENYNSILKSDVYTMYKLKEIWMYAMLNYPEEKKVMKMIKKSTRLSDLLNVLKNLGEINYG